jgi:hypothetical protein
VFNSYSTEKNPFHLGMIHDPVLKRMATGTERIWFSKEIAHVPPTEYWFAAFLRRAEMLGAPPLIIHWPNELLRNVEQDTSYQVTAADLAAIARLPAAERIGSKVLRYRPEELVLDVRTAAEGWLLVTDRWARSWQVEVNGRPTAVYGGNFIFRAIRVSAGQNRVRFTYRPFGFPWLVGLSWGTMALVVVYTVHAAVSRRRLRYLPNRRLAKR